MCVVLRCCSDTESQSIFDLEEINLSATGYHHKPTAIVDGQPVRFARVQPLGDSSQAMSSVATAPGGGAGGSNGSSHLQEEIALERLEMPIATSALPSAQAVWSPILALRTFVEPLTSRASAAFRNFHVSFHDPEEEGAGVVGVGVTATSTLPAEAAAPASPPSLVAAAAAVVADEEQGGDARDGGGRRKERLSPTAARADAVAAAAAPEEVRVASAGQFGSPGSREIELSVVSSRHDRAPGGGFGGGDEERKRVDSTEHEEEDGLYECRVAV
eukprot:g6785.t1